MLIVAYQTCEHCGRKVELLTDGRMAEVSVRGDYIEVDPVEVIDGLYHVQCPALDPISDDQCPGVLIFTGEGRSAEGRELSDRRAVVIIR